MRQHDIRMEPLPVGRGCGEQWVRERYSNAVKAYRSRAPRARTAPFVAIDADIARVDDRQQQLRDALNRTGEAQRGTAERIIHLIPKRSVETWILSLQGQDVDEMTDYRWNPDIEHFISTSAAVFFQATRAATVPPTNCPSLHHGIVEAKRFG